MQDGTLLGHMLNAMQNDILPLTRQGVAQGNKIFGAALLDRRTGAVVLAGTNNETENPLWHGEVHTLKLLHEMADPPNPKDLLFLSTHEPCSMCLSAITWAGFDNFYYFFSHEDSRDAFAIPHDLRILKEVFTLDPGGYRHKNAYWTARSIPAMLAEERDAALAAQADAIRAEYDALSNSYQQGKGDNAIPLN